MKNSQPQSLDPFFDGIISQAIQEIREAGLALYTFAFYHDHESRAVAVCADSAESSARSVSSSNQFTRKYFGEALMDGDLKEMAGWQGNHGRNLSLGDFAMVNISRTDLEDRIKTTKEFYVAMIRAVIRHEPEIVALAQNPDQLIFCCSGPRDEVAFIWSPAMRATKRIC